MAINIKQGFFILVFVCKNMKIGDETFFLLYQNLCITLPILKYIKIATF